MSKPIPLFRDGVTPATEAEILSAAGAIASSRASARGRKPALTGERAETAKSLISKGFPVSRVAKKLGVSPCAVRTAISGPDIGTDPP